MINNSYRHSLLIILITVIMTSCHSSRYLTQSRIDNVKKEIDISPVFNQHFTGFYLYNPLSEKAIISYNSDKYFTPASNTKVLTFLTSLHILEDSLDIIKYGYIGKDSLIFRGTGYPMSLNSEALNDTILIDFLRHRKEKIFYCEDNFQMERFGSGWAWDDAGYYYQRDLSPLPLYGNAIRFKYDGAKTHVYPHNLDSLLDISQDTKSSFHYYDGHYKISLDTTTVQRYLPFETSYNTSKQLLSNAIKKKIYNCPEQKYVDYSKNLRVKLDDSIYIRLLHQSDNFIAEQLLLMCSSQLFDTIKTSKVIDYSKNNFFDETYKNFRWVDGSGLSRYNLISPEVMVYSLNEIKKMIGMDRIKILFPAAGSNGTLQNWYGNHNEKGENHPYIYAKTGSLSNNHTLSGYLITKSGKVLIFSFMHNHFLESSSVVKKEMQRILELIRNTID